MATIHDYRYLVGMDLTEARTIHSNIRVREEDGLKFMGTEDHDLSRLNVKVEAGKIVELLSVG